MIYVPYSVKYLAQAYLSPVGICNHIGTDDRRMGRRRHPKVSWIGYKKLASDLQEQGNAEIGENINQK